jgi:hypothetical protein
MQKQIKNIILISIIGIVIFQTLIDILNFYNTEISEIRRNSILNNETLIKTKIFSLEEWNNFDSKKEIKINGIHFDVVNYSIKKNKVIVNGFEDNFEDELNFIFKKNKEAKNKNIPCKKKLFKLKYLLSKPSNLFINNLEANFDPFTKIKVLKNIGKITKIESKKFKPPRLII